MAPIDRDKLSFEDDPAPIPELDALAECLRREASELSAMYPPGSAERVPLEQLPSTQTAGRRIMWKVAAAVAVLVVGATTWTALRPGSVGPANAPSPRQAVPALTVGVDDRPRVPAARPERPDVVPRLPANQIGAYDMNGPELEAVLNLLEGNRTSLKLAL